MKFILKENQKKEFEIGICSLTIINSSQREKVNAEFIKYREQ